MEKPPRQDALRAANGPAGPADFDGDPHPGAPKILFIGAAQSSHTRAWIDLLASAEINPRLFALPSGLPPADWPVPTYLTNPLAANLDPELRLGLYPPCAPAPPPATDLAQEPDTEAIAAPGQKRDLSEKVKDKLLTGRIADYQQAQQAHQRAEEAFNQARQAFRQAEQEYNGYKQIVEVNQRWLKDAIHGWKQQNFAAQPARHLIDPQWRADFAQLGREELWLPCNPGQGSYLPFKVYESGLDEESWLARIIQSWRPDIIQTMGLEDGAYFYFPVRQRFGLQGVGKWVIQTRGGSDLALTRHEPEVAEVMRQVLGACDQVITDNKMNYAYLEELGVPPQKLCPLCPLPGTGGVAVEALSQGLQPPSKRQRLILWPKAYESPWSKALPVLEALRLAWPEIAPCELHLLVAGPEVRAWAQTLPAEIRQGLHFHERIEREEVFELMARSRVMLAPSLVDGVPNTLYEAMAAGAFPILSPLETIQTLVSEPENVLFAKNLYPEELAGALTRAMNQDGLVDKAAEVNLALVKKVADRAEIAPKLAAYYQELTGAGVN
jgi:glycosyl transferase family 1